MRVYVHGDGLTVGRRYHGSDSQRQDSKVKPLDGAHVWNEVRLRRGG